jgi:endonuclease I
MKRKTLLTLCLLAASIGIWAQGPNGSGTYYRNANGKSGAALKTAMHDIISQKKKNLKYKELWEIYKITDTRADGKVRDWYSNITNYTHITDKAGSYQKEGDVYNREHSVPQSWGSPEADIMHVIPTDGYVNNRRSNFPFGEVGTISYQSANGYSKLGACKTPGYSGKVFEPNDEVKGDIARIYFYMATCYEGDCQNWGNGVFTGTVYQPLAQWTFDMMVRWSKLDPIDDVEIARNKAVYRSDVQGNRNPFVDYPGLEDYVWGSKREQPFSYDHYDEGEVIIVEQVARPVFSPNGGTFTDSVDVTITTATEGAAIYYTTDGATPTENSMVYEGAITLKTNTLLKTIAVKEGMDASDEASARFIINSSGGEVIPVEDAIALNNRLFGTSFGGAITTKEMDTFTGTVGGITVSYDKGTGSNMFVNDEQLRLYPGNTLTITSDKGALTSVEFTVAGNKGNKILQANTGTVNGYTWRGDAQSVVFSVDAGSGNLQLSQLKVATASSEPSEGDVTGDGSVDMADLSAIVQSVCGGINNPQADVNHDGRVDIGDIMTLIRLMAKNK